MSTKDIWVFSKAKVANKGVMARIGHSARFHSVRSAVNSKGSAGSKILKGLGALGRASFALIPIPVIGTLLASVESAVEGKIREWSHSRHNATFARTNAVADVDVKFALKEMSVENLDRYRFKVEHAVAEMTSAGNAFDAEQTKAGQANKPCDPQLALALKVAQAERRLEIFEKEITGLLIILDASQQWAQKSRVSVNNYKEQVNEHFSKVAEAELAMVNAASANAAEKALVVEQIKVNHSACGDFCFQNDNMSETSWDRFRANAADVVRTCQAPFDPESFLSLNRASFESANQVDNYKHPNDRA